MIINTVFTGSSIRALNGLLATTVPPVASVHAALATSAHVMILLARRTASTRVARAK